MSALEIYPTDHNGKLLTCSKSEFVAGGANRQCTRPPNHQGPCAFPTDRAHIACQKALSELQAAHDEFVRTTKVNEIALADVLQRTSRSLADARDIALVALGYLELHAMAGGGNKQGAVEIAQRMRKVLGVAP